MIVRRGECVETLRKLHDEHPFETIWAHQETGNWISYQRDLRVLSWAKETGIQYKEFYQNGVIRKLNTRDGWSRIWNQRMNEKIIATPSSIHSPENIDYGEILSPNNFDLNSLDRRFTYSFVLQHPFNRIVTPIMNPLIYLVKIYEIVHLNNNSLSISYIDCDVYPL